jgi:hypothetical protein
MLLLQASFVFGDAVSSVNVNAKLGIPSLATNVSGVYSVYHTTVGAHSSVVVKALCYKPEGRGFDSR